MDTVEHKDLSDLLILQKNVSELSVAVSSGTEEQLKYIQSRYEVLDSIEKEISACLPSIRQEKGKLKAAISALQGTSYSGDKEDGEIDSPDTATVTCGNATVDDIRGHSQRQAMYVIAGKNDNLLPLNNAVDLVVAAGLNKGTRKSSLSTLHHYLSNNPDFKWISPSTFLLLTGEDEPDPTTGEEWAQAERANGTSTNGFNHHEARQQAEV